MRALLSSIMIVLAFAMIFAAGNMLTTGFEKIAQTNFFGPAMIQQNGKLPPFKYEDNRQSKNENKRYPIIRLTYEDKKGKDQFVCSAFVVSNLYAITAAHCIVDRAYFIRLDQIRIYDENNMDTGVTAEAAAVNLRVDYGVVKGDFKSFNKVRIEEQMDGFQYTQGPYASFGYPWGGEMMVAPLRIMPNISRMFNIHVLGPIYPGMSGGPVIDTSTGVAIGINHAVDESAGSLITPLVNFFDALDMEIKR